MSDATIGIIAVAVIIIMLIAITAGRKKMNWLINIMLRAVFGALGIYFINTVLTAFELPVTVGLNIWSVGLVGILGFPGLLLLYAVRAFSYFF